MSNESTIKQLHELHAEIGKFMTIGQQIQNKIVNMICDISSGKEISVDTEINTEEEDRIKRKLDDARHVQAVTGISQTNPEVCKEAEKTIKKSTESENKKDHRIVNEIVIDNISDKIPYLRDSISKIICSDRDIYKAIFGTGGNEGSFTSYVKEVCAPNITRTEWEKARYGTRGGKTPYELPRLRFVNGFISQSKIKAFLEETNYYERFEEDGCERIIDEYGNEKFYTYILLESFKDEYKHCVQKLLSDEYVKKHKKDGVNEE